MRAIAVVNQKGGCGKTTTSINLSAFLAREQRNTLVIDMDPQGHATLGLLTDSAQPAGTMADVFSRPGGRANARLRDIIRPIHQNLDLAPADILLSAVPDALHAAPGRERVLSDLLDDVSDAYDYIIVDCPPGVGLLTFNALMACSEAIMPMDPSFFSLHGIAKLLETFDVVARNTGHQIAPRALVTLYAGRSQFAKDVVDEIRKHLRGRHFNTVIRYSIKLAEAASHGLPIVRYCQHCAGFEDYDALSAEVLAMEATLPLSDRARTRPSRHESPSTPSAPRAIRDGVIFTLEAPEAQCVQLVGDFNGWTQDGNEMQPVGRIWTSVLKLVPGRYRYRYVVDGQWQSDPLNAEVEPAPYGGHNSVLVLGGDERVSA